MVWSPGDEVFVVVVVVVNDVACNDADAALLLIDVIVVVIDDVACVVVAAAGGRGGGRCGQQNSIHDGLLGGITAGGSEGYNRETSCQFVSFDLQAFCMGELSGAKYAGPTWLSRQGPDSWASGRCFV